MITFDNILILLEESGKTQKELAEYIGVAKSRITDWKSGRVNSYTKYLPQIAEFLGVSVNTLIGDTTPPYRPHKKKNVLRVPVLGRVAAGIPIEAIEDIEDYEELDADQYPAGEYIALRIKGHSMEPRMMDGDVVIVHLQDDVNTGDTAVVMVNGGEATCKKIKKTPEGVTLISTNSAFDPMFYSNQEIIETPVCILGKVVELRAKY